MAVITISRYFGAGGAKLGERLAGELGYRFINDQLIKEVAKHLKVSLGQVESYETRVNTKLEKMLNFIVSQHFLERHSDKYGYVSERVYVEGVKSVILKLYEAGDCVIVGRGGNYALQGYPGTLHILLVADDEHRRKFLMDEYRMTESQAGQVINRADMLRSLFLDCLSPDHNHDDPRLYTMTLNMNHMSMDKAVEFVKSLALEIK